MTRATPWPSAAREREVEIRGVLVGRMAFDARARLLDLREDVRLHGVEVADHQVDAAAERERVLDARVGADHQGVAAAAAP